MQFERISGEQILPIVDIFEGQIGGGHAGLSPLPAPLPRDREDAPDVQHVVVILAGWGQQARAKMEYCRAEP